MEIYRDPTEGVLARRRELVRERREELALLPHVVRRIVVARRARIAASRVAIFAGGVLAAAACSTAFAKVLSKLMPGPDPAPLTTLLVVSCTVTIVAYFASRAMHEHRFAVAMSHCVSTSADLAHDVERFTHEGPHRVAREIAERLEWRSTVLPMIGAALLLPPLEGYATFAVAARGWPDNADFEQFVRTHHGIVAVLACIAAVVTAYVLRHRVHGERERIATDDPTAGSEVFTWRVFLAQTKARVVAICARITRRQLVYASALWGLAALSLFVWHRETTSRPKATLAMFEPAAIQPAPAPAPPFEAAPSRRTGILYRAADGALLVDVDREAVELQSLDGIEWVPANWHAHITLSAYGADLEATPLLGDATRHVANGDATELDVCQTTPRRLGLHIDPMGHRATLRIAVALDTDCSAGQFK